MLNCKEASALISQQLDRKLSVIQRLSLRLHLFICKNCTNFTQQMQLFRKIGPKLEQHIDHHCDDCLSDAAKNKIKQRIAEANKTQDT